MKKRNILISLILSAVLGIISSNSHAAQSAEETEKFPNSARAATAAFVCREVGSDTEKKGTIRILNIKAGDDSVLVRHFSDFPEIVQVVEDFIDGKNTEPDFFYMTPREAQEEFYPLLVKKVGEVQAKTVAPVVFSDKNFGYHDFPSRAEVVDECSIEHAVNRCGATIQAKCTTMDKIDEPLRYVPILNLATAEMISRAFHKGPNFHNMEKQGLVKQIYNLNNRLLPGYGQPSSSDPAERKDFYLNKSHGCAGLTPQLMREIHVSSKRIMQLSRQGDVIIGFGNTPFYLLHAIGFYISSNPDDENYRRVVSFPFSGAPNKGRNSDDKPENQDIVTPKRLEHLRMRINKARLDPDSLRGANPTIWVLDAMASGSGPGYFTEVLLRQFLDQGLAPPDIRLISTYPLMLGDPIKKLRDRIQGITSKSIPDGATELVTFPSRQTPRFMVPVSVVQVDLRNLDNIRSDNVKELRTYAEYPAARWAPEYPEPTMMITLYNRLRLEYAQYWGEKLSGNSVNYLSDTITPASLSVLPSETPVVAAAASAGS